MPKHARQGWCGNAAALKAECSLAYSISCVNENGSLKSLYRQKHFNVVVEVPRDLVDADKLFHPLQELAVVELSIQEALDPVPSSAWSALGVAIMSSQPSSFAGRESRDAARQPCAPLCASGRSETASPSPCGVVGRDRPTGRPGSVDLQTGRRVFRIVEWALDPSPATILGCLENLCGFGA